jgi:hypothetical protein
MKSSNPKDHGAVVAHQDLGEEETVDISKASRLNYVLKTL